MGCSAVKMKTIVGEMPQQAPRGKARGGRSAVRSSFQDDGRSELANKCVENLAQSMSHRANECRFLAYLRRWIAPNVCILVSAKALWLLGTDLPQTPRKVLRAIRFTHLVKLGDLVDVEFETRRDTLRHLLAEAKKAGYKIRQEWLGGETGGACEIHGVHWVFLDSSLSLDEQIEQLRDALSKEIAQ